MTRLPDWQKRLVEVEASLDRQGWDWGVHDCATATLRVLEAITGAELLADHGGALTPRARMKIASRDLFARVVDGAEELGLDACRPEYLQRGDPCVARVDGRTAFAFISSRGRPTVADTEGLTELPLDSILFGWSIPCRT